MPILQVSRITQRKGLNSDLPSPLASAELGWAIDERRLYIGNGSLDEGAPVIGNTEILTEFSDLLAYTTAYTYQGSSAGYIVQTGVSTASPVTRSIQSRLDDMVVVKQFGATGDGVTDDTDAINRALFQLYCRQANPQIRRGLYFPAGTYKVSDTILIPPYAKIYGDGANSSIIRFSVTTWVADTGYAQGVLVTDGSDYYRSVAAVPAGASIALTDTNYWNQLSASEFPAYVARTTDSLQQTGVNIGSGGATRPRDVELSDLRFQTDFAGDGVSISHDVCLLEQLQRGRCDRVDFVGALTTAEANAATEALAGVRFANTAAVPCQNITIDGCRMQGLTYGVYADCLVEGFTVSNGWFDTLYQGVVMTPNGTAALGEPTGMRVMHNMFDNVYAQGILIDSCALNASGYNTFYDVGNHFNGLANPATAIIDINEANNVSVGDLFARTTAQELTGFPRIKLWNSTTTSVPASYGFTGSSQISLGSYTRETGQQLELDGGQTDATLFTVDTSVTRANGGFRTLSVDYTIYREVAGLDVYRKGRMTVIAGDADDSSVAVVSFEDDSTENADTGIQLTATESGSTLTFSYSSTAGNAADFYYSISHLA